MADQTRKLEPTPAADDPSRPPDIGGGPPARVALGREVEALQGRIDVLRDGPGSDPPEVFRALDSTMEALRAAVEELRRADGALRDAKAEVEAERRRYRDLFDLAPDPYLITDLHGTIREANRAASVQLNIDHHFLDGKPMVVFLPEEGRPAFRSELARLKDVTATQEYDLRLQPRHLPPFDAAMRVGVVRDAWGQPTALRWSIRDVSARRRAEEKIRALNAQLERRVVERSEQLDDSLQANERWLIKAHAADTLARAEGRLFQDLVEEVDAILWRADAATGHYTFVSRRAEELLGHPASRWTEDPGFWLDRIHPEDRDWAAAHRRKQLREGRDHEAEYRVVAADGHALWFRESIRILKGEPDRPAVLCGLMVNITKRKKVERQLYTAKGELAMQLRDMNYLHELGGRLAAARGRRATCDEVLSAVTSLQGADMAMVLLRDRDDDRLTVAASLGLAPALASLVSRGPLDPADLGLPIDSRQALLVEDVEAGPVDPRVRHAARVGGFRALSGVPLFNRDGEHLGAVVTLFRAPYRPPDRQARLVEMYAEHAADAIEASRPRGRVGAADGPTGPIGEERAVEFRAALAEILEAARSIPADPGRARDLIVRDALRLLEALDGPHHGGQLGISENDMAIVEG